MAARLHRQWSRCLGDTADVVETLRIRFEDGSTRPPEPGEILLVDDETADYYAAGQLTWAAIAQQDPETVLLHGAGLDWQGSGRVLTLIATSGTGKTTACLRLATGEHGYVTDEVVSVHADDAVTAYPKPLSLVDDPERPYRKRQAGPDELGLRPCGEELRLGPIVLLERVRTAEPHQPSLEPLHPVDALLELVASCLSVPTLAAPLVRLGELVSSRGVHRLTYAELADALPLLTTLMADPSHLAADPSHLAADPSHLAAITRSVGFPAPAAGRGDRLFQARVADAVAIADEVVVLRETTPIRLTPLGATLWTTCATGATDADLVRAAVRDHGAHPEAEAIVRDTVATMLAEDLLVRA